MFALLLTGACLRLLCRLPSCLPCYLLSPFLWPWIGAWLPLLCCCSCLTFVSFPVALDLCFAAAALPLLLLVSLHVCLTGRCLPVALDGCLAAAALPLFLFVSVYVCLAGLCLLPMALDWRLAGAALPLLLLVFLHSCLADPYLNQPPFGFEIYPHHGFNVPKGLPCPQGKLELSFEKKCKHVAIHRFFAFRLAPLDHHPAWHFFQPFVRAGGEPTSFVIKFYSEIISKIFLRDVAYAMVSTQDKHGDKNLSILMGLIQHFGCCLLWMPKTDQRIQGYFYHITEIFQHIA